MKGIMEKVYIKGVRGMGKEVIAKLESLGGTNYYVYSGESDELIYFIGCSGKICAKSITGRITSTILKWIGTEIFLDEPVDNKEKPTLYEMCKPTWDVEKDGVYIPLLNIVIDKTNLKEGADKNGGFKWDDAMEAVKKTGKRMLAKEEWQLIRYWKDEINCLLIKHGGKEIKGYYWCCSEYYEYNAWYVNFNSGSTNNIYKHNTNYVRPVSQK